MPDLDIDDRDPDDLPFEKPHKAPLPPAPIELTEIDPVPEPLRPTAWRLTSWTLVAFLFFVLVGAVFLGLQIMNGPNSTTATNPPATAVKQTQSQGNG